MKHYIKEWDTWYNTSEELYYICAMKEWGKMPEDTIYVKTERGDTFLFYLDGKEILEGSIGVVDEIIKICLEAKDYEDNIRKIVGFYKQKVLETKYDKALNKRYQMCIQHTGIALNKFLKERRKREKALSAVGC